MLKCYLLFTNLPSSINYQSNFIPPVNIYLHHHHSIVLSFCFTTMPLYILTSLYIFLYTTTFNLAPAYSLLRHHFASQYYYAICFTTSHLLLHPSKDKGESSDISADCRFSNPLSIKRPTMTASAAAPSSPPKIHVNPLIARGKMSDDFLKPCMAHISPGVTRRPFNDQRSSTLPRKVNSSSYSVCSLPRPQSHTMTRSLKKKSTFSNSKQSLKDFLQNKPQCML